MLKNKIISAYLTNILGVISDLVTNFWLLRELTGRVSESEFGIYSLTFQVASYLVILQLGLDFSASRSIASYLGNNEPGKASTAFAALVRFNKRLGVVAMLLLFAGVYVVMDR